MNVLYEEEGSFKVGHVLSEAEATLQVESSSGKRSKIKATHVLLRFTSPLASLLPEAEALGEGLELDFLWEMAPTEEFAFTEFAADYYGHVPSAVESAAMALRLHGAPMYFYRKGKGRYKAAPEESLKAALAGQEKKRLQGEQIARMVAELKAGQLPESFRPQLAALLYRPDKNTLEFKALDQAVSETARSPLQLLIDAGAVPSHHDYHFNAFLFEYFPKGTGFPPIELPALDHDLPRASVAAFSIDDASTTEIDDAFSVQFRPDGSARVGIHIAAPALGIAPGSPLDQIALSRLSTVYMPGNKITMLPDELVTHYTLQAGKDCPALSLYVEVGADLTVTPAETVLEWVPIVDNLRHDTLEVHFNQAALQAGDDTPYPYRDELLFLWRLANQLEVARGKADPNRPPQVDYNFLIDGEQVRITTRQRGAPIDKVVSELMILVNSHWGKWLAEQQIPAIYRAQSAGKVRMTTKPEPHVGLGVAQYAWSSSPLRRAVDLLNQRQLVAAVRGEKAPYPKGQDLFVPMRDFDATYSAYLQLQDRMENYWCLRYLEQEQIRELDATVLRDGSTVRLVGIPLVVKPDAMPELPPGSRVRLKVMGVDYWAIHCHTHFLRSVDAEATEPVMTDA